MGNKEVSIFVLLIFLSFRLWYSYSKLQYLFVVYLQ